MDFEDTPEQAAFREECIAWLEANAQRRPSDGGAEVWKTFRPKDDAEEQAAWSRAREWQARKADAGYAGIQWPTEYNGRGLSPQFAGLFKTEELNFDVQGNAFQVAVDMVGPTLIAHGTPEQREAHLEDIRRGQAIWCQLFSEPGAGSDLASLSTRAERDGDVYVVSGQKVWTSSAHASDWGILLARTDIDVPKHRGISYFLIDMHSPGVEVRPLRQADGASHFSEVFLTDVLVPATNLVGDLGDGWRVAQTTLMAERSAIASTFMVQFDELLMLANHMDITDDPTWRQRLAEIYSLFEISRFLNYRVQTSMERGEGLTSESSVMKLHICRQYKLACEAATDMQSAAGMLRDDQPFGGWFGGLLFAQWAPRIGGGTEQVQRNIVGERVLGLPSEPRPDRSLPFRELSNASARS